MIGSKSIEIEDAQIISETLGDSGSGFIDFIARQVDKLTSRNRGSWITETIILSDLALDKEALRNEYQANKSQIDSYFDQVDVQKVMKTIAPDQIERIQYTFSERTKNNLPGFMIGGLTGAVITAIILQKRKK
jgi:hypothetical protein